MTFFFEHPAEPEPHAPPPLFARPAPPARSEAADGAVEAKQSAAGDVVASIREAIETLSCEEDYPTIRMTAKLVGMSVRTLQRRLAQAGATHHMLVAQARFATAAAVLEQTDAKILNLALDLGYSDHANFTRAFRRWAGCAPREYRSRTAPHEGVRDRSSSRHRSFEEPRGQRLEREGAVTVVDRQVIAGERRLAQPAVCFQTIASIEVSREDAPPGSAHPSVLHR